MTILMAGFSRRWRDWLCGSFPELTIHSVSSQTLLARLAEGPCSAVLLGPNLKAGEVLQVLNSLQDRVGERPRVLYCAGREGWDRSGEGLDRLLLPPVGRRRLAQELARLVQRPPPFDSEERAGSALDKTGQELFRGLSLITAAGNMAVAAELALQLSGVLQGFGLRPAAELADILASQLLQGQRQQALLTCLQLRSRMHPQSWAPSEQVLFPRLLIFAENPELVEELRQSAESEGFQVFVADSSQSPIPVFLETAPDALILSLASAQPAWVDALLVGWPRLPLVLLAQGSDWDLSAEVRRERRSVLFQPVSAAHILERLCFQVDRQRRRPYRVYLADSRGRDHDPFRAALARWEIEVSEVPDEPADLWLMDAEQLRHSALPIGHPPVLGLRDSGGASALAVDCLPVPISTSDFLERARRLWSPTGQEVLEGSEPWLQASFCIEQLLRLAARHGQPASVAVLRPVGQPREGRSAVHQRLLRLAKALNVEMRAEDVVARLGESMLLLAMYGMRRADGLARLAHHLGADAFNAGLAEFPEDGDDLTTLLQSAEQALKAAELAGCGRVVYVGWSEADALANSVDILFISHAQAPGADELIRGFDREGYSHYRWDYDPAARPDDLPEHWRLSLVQPPPGADWQDFAPILDTLGAGSRSLILIGSDAPPGQDWKCVGIETGRSTLMKCLRDKLGFKGAWTVRSKRENGLRRRQILFSQLSVARRDQEQAEAIISSMQKREDTLSTELALARDIQQNLLPRQVPSTTGWEFHFAVVPARVVGGDLVHCSTHPRGVRVALADVSGKGVPAAILVGSLHEILRTTEHLPLPEAISEINDAFFRITPSEVSVALMLLHFAPDSGRVEICNCGCPEPLLIQGETVSAVQGSGLPLGWFAAATTEYQTITLQPGETLLLYSDGLLDAYLPGSLERVGESRIYASLSQGGEVPLPEIARKLLFLVDQATQPDDVAIWVARRTSAASVE